MQMIVLLFKLLFRIEQKWNIFKWFSIVQCNGYERVLAWKARPHTGKEGEKTPSLPFDAYPQQK